MVTERYSSTELNYARIRFASGFFCLTYPNFISKTKNNINLTPKPLNQCLGFKMLDNFENFKGGN